MNTAASDVGIITTWSGRHVNLLAPSPRDIVIDDIAASLSEIRRFNGHTARPFTVAEHSLLGLEYCSPERRLEFLLHDATEAYLGDVVGPMKMLQGMQAYRDLEAIWAGAIADRFGLKRGMSKEVNTIDKRMLVTERRDLMGRMPVSTDKFEPYPMHIGMVAPSAEVLGSSFLDRFYSLVSKTEGAIR
jgi:hypothetical protein